MCFVVILFELVFWGGGDCIVHVPAKENELNLCCSKTNKHRLRGLVMSQA